jgi:hypothetical protein
MADGQFESGNAQMQTIVMNAVIAVVAIVIAVGRFGDL